MFVDVYINYFLLLTQSSKNGVEESFNASSFALCPLLLSLQTESTTAV